MKTADVLIPQIIFENKDLIVIDKPSGLIVNRAQTTKGFTTLQDWLADYLGNKVLPWKLRMGLVHRLDKETCGLMVLAKSKLAYFHLLTEFKERRVEKKYLTLLHGKLSPNVGSIRLPIKRDPRNRKKFSVYVGGRMAITFYQVLSFWQKPKEKIKSKKYFSYVKVDLKTGRTHQIRVHFSHLHHPVVADDIYGGRKTNRSDRSWCPHLFLQSFWLAFTDHRGKKHTFKLALHPELEQAIANKLEQISCA